MSRDANCLHSDSESTLTNQLNGLGFLCDITHLPALSVFGSTHIIASSHYAYAARRQASPHLMRPLDGSGVPRNFVPPGGGEGERVVQQIQLRTERTGIWGTVAP